MSVTTLTYNPRPPFTRPGPWDDEPDRMQWTDEATGLVCLARRQPNSGHWCGYVGVDAEHPLNGKGYSECWLAEPCGDVYCDHGPMYLVDVHGGITYADGCDDDPTEGVCHLPEPGEPDHLWWFGFDCAHYCDLRPAAPLLPGFTDDHDDLSLTYRTLDYVRSECARLAAQLAAEMAR